MSLGRVKRVAALCLCLYAAAFLHQVLPHHHQAGDAACCSFCLLVFGVALGAAIVSATPKLSRSMAVFALPREGHRLRLAGPACLRGPPSTNLR